jgi:hypothetical protein
MVWGGIALGYKSELLRVDENITTQKYIEMLKNYEIIEKPDLQYVPGERVFQDDGASLHRARVTPNGQKSNDTRCP